MRPQVFVVEGKNDQFRLEKCLNHPLVITTNGSAIDQDKMELLKKLDETHDIVLFLDPDHAGERIRRLVAKSLKNVYHAFVEKENAQSKNFKKVGVEHADCETIHKSLAHIQIVRYDIKSDVTHSFLHEVGLTGSPVSKKLREFVCRELGIGFTNGKTLYHRLRMFGIDRKRILEVIYESSSEKEIRTELFKR